MSTDHPAGTYIIRRRLAPVAQNLFVYLWQAIRHWRLIVMIAGKIIRDFTARTVLGFWWLILRAIMPTIGLIVILQHIEVLRDPQLPYALYVISGMVLWTSIDIGLMKGIRSMMQTARLSHHFYFPRIIVPLAANAVPIVYHLVFLVFLLGTISWFWMAFGQMYIKIGPELIWALAMVTLNFLLVAGLVAFLSVTFMIARDVRFVLPIVRQIWFLATPIIYPIELLPAQWAKIILLLNPAASIIETLRWSLFGIGSFQPLYVMTATTQVLITLILGAWFTMRSERILKAVL